jgi:O-methyltransferase
VPSQPVEVKATVNTHIKSLVDFDARHDMFGRALRFIDYEMIPGDIVEFGVYTGRSLVLLAHYHEAFKDTIHGHLTPRRQVIGLDSFHGLQKNSHQRWAEGVFRFNQSYHPTIPMGEAVTPERVVGFFAECALPVPLIISGYYSDVSDEFDSATDRVALVHIDCDLYESTLQALNMVRHKIQDGTIVLFDDWFNFRGSRNEGEQKAFGEFLDCNPQLEAIPYHPYVTFGNSFILKMR